VVPDRRGAHQSFFRSTAETALATKRWNGVANVYVGASPRTARSGARSAVANVTAAWADLDFHQLDPCDRQRAETLAHDRMTSFSRRPTILVHTGNGLQDWWLYTEPVPISEAWPAERFEAINRGLAQALGGDAVHDLARVLRVPGTLNLPDAKKRARGCVPVMAKLLWADGPTYRPSDFDDLAVDVAPSTKGSVAPRVRVQLVQPSQPDAEILDAFQRLLERLGPSHPLCRTWRGDRHIKDTSRSGWDWSLVNELIRTGIRGEFIPTIVRGFRMGRGVFARDDYIERTMAKARAWVRGRHGTRDTA